jgi:predicted metalloprotease
MFDDKGLQIMRFAFFSIAIWLALAGLASAQDVPSASPQKPGDDVEKFAAVVLGNVNREWSDIFQQNRETYRKPTLVVYRNEVRAACSSAQATGSFYCPADGRIYLDISFFRDIGTKLHGCEAGSKACRFSQAYVIAHQVGHHVQNLLGILPKVQLQKQRMDPVSADLLQARAELQADCFAGLWAKHENDRLRQDGKPPLGVEAGDIETALRAASAIGDDMLHRKATGRVVPDSLTHGSPEQRQRWFLAGYQVGTVASCNTFKSTD